MDATLPELRTIYIVWLGWKDRRGRRVWVRGFDVLHARDEATLWRARRLARKIGARLIRVLPEIYDSPDDVSSVVRGRLGGWPAG